MEEEVVEIPIVEEPVQPEQPAQEEVISQPVEQEQKETSAQLNFKALREEKERIERDHQEALNRLKQYEEKSKPKEEEVDFNLGDDDLFEGKHYKALQKQLKKQQDQLNQYQSQVNLTTTESRLKSQYNDFDKVVSESNIKKLRELEPELAETIASNQDMYTKAVSAYKMIKKLGIFVEDNYAQDREVAQRNSLKPRPSAYVSPQQSDSPLTKANAFANGLTPDLKKQLWKEMNEASKQY